MNLFAAVVLALCATWLGLAVYMIWKYGRGK